MNDAHRGGSVPIEIDPKLFHDIQTALSRLVSKAGQLIDNATTNVAESWMHVRSKYDGGKVINRSQSGSWEHRCMGAGLQQNLGKQWGPEVWKGMTSASPNKIFTSTVERSARRSSKNKERKGKEDVKAKRRASKYQGGDDTQAARRAYNRHDNSLSPDEIDDDIPPDHLEQLKTSFYSTKVMVCAQESNRIERGSVDQADNELWLCERRKRITASNVGMIAKMKATTKCGKKVEQLLYSKFRGNAATRFGTSKEEQTREEYQIYMKKNGHSNLSVETCGLFVSTESPWLAASPDGLVTDPQDEASPLGLVEIKNPYSAREQTLAEAAASSSFCLRQNKDGNHSLKPRHNYYHQVQCQLYCTQRDWCDFVVKTGKEMHVERIRRDNSWFKSNSSRLKKFYFNCLLPELACPRHRKGGIREFTCSYMSFYLSYFTFICSNSYLLLSMYLSSVKVQSKTCS